MAYLNNINDTRLIIHGLDYQIATLANMVDVQPSS
jgi:hypothetical protein